MVKTHLTHETFREAWKFSREVRNDALLNVACEAQTHFRSSILSLRSDDRKCVCASQAMLNAVKENFPEHFLSLGLNGYKTLRVISIKFLLVISTFYKTEWSRELRTGCHEMNLLDILTISHYYFCRKYVRATNENMDFILGFKGINSYIPRIPGLREKLPGGSASSFSGSWLRTIGFP